MTCPTINHQLKANPTFKGLEVAFVASGLADRDILIASIRPNVTVVDLADTEDGLAQILNFLYLNDDVRVLHLVTHGASGRIDLGATTLTADNIWSYKESLNAIGALLADAPEIHLYGCEVGAGVAGESFVNSLSQLTSVSIAASTNLTGSEALGGDWDLEMVVGSTTTEGAFLMSAVQAYPHVLAVSDATFDSGSLTTYSSVNSANYDGWTFGASSSIDIANPNASEIPLLLNQAGGRSISLNYSIAAVSDYYFKSADGSEFEAGSLPEITATLTSLGLLGALPDQATLNGLVEDVTSGTPLIEIIGSMLASGEYHDRFL